MENNLIENIMGIIIYLTLSISTLALIIQGIIQKKSFIIIVGIIHTIILVITTLWYSPLILGFALGSLIGSWLYILAVRKL